MYFFGENITTKKKKSIKIELEDNKNKNKNNHNDVWTSKIRIVDEQKELEETKILMT